MLTPEMGCTYSKFVRNDSEWGIERRFVLDVSMSQVFYEVIVDQPLGTIVEPEPIRKQVDIDEWDDWAKTAEVSY